ncbi:MAG: hypothetical protein S4CHLAM81_07740 [Chlamydiales bacterium]|nr:hypothetical protein [Chlamydiales bacterium]
MLVRRVENDTESKIVAEDAGWELFSVSIKGEKPQKPVLLMRSRYCAYALGLVDYILRTQEETLNKYLARDFGKISIEGKFGAERLTPCGLVEARTMPR